MRPRRRLNGLLAGCATAGVLAVCTAGIATGNGAVAPQPVLLPSLVLGGEGPVVGSVVRVDAGAWSGGPTGFAYRWERCGPEGLGCVVLPAAAEAAYVPVAADAGSTLRAVVQAQGPGGRGEAATATSPLVTGGPVTATASAVTAGDAATLGGLPVRVSRTLGSVAVLDGVLRQGPGGTPLGGRDVTLRDPWGATLDTAVTGGDGRFSLAARVLRPGPWSVSAAGTTTVVGVRARPVVRLLSATRHVRPPAVVALRGRIAPRVAGKIVQLQYLDPSRGWRLWKQARTDRTGAFALRRVLQPNPRAPRFTLRVRAVVPADVGWPFAPAATRVVAVRVG